MATLTHCGVSRPATVLWLDSLDRRYKVQILLLAECPQCQRMRMAWYGIRDDGKKGPLQHIKPRDGQDWIDRVVQTGQESKRVGRGAGPLVSDYSRMICQSPERVYEQVIARA